MIKSYHSLSNYQVSIEFYLYTLPNIHLTKTFRTLELFYFVDYVHDRIKFNVQF